MQNISIIYNISLNINSELVRVWITISLFDLFHEWTACVNNIYKICLNFYEMNRSFEFLKSFEYKKSKYRSSKKILDMDIISILIGIYILKKE